MKKYLLLSFFLPVLNLSAQTSDLQFHKYPVFPECENTAVENLETCFNSTLQRFVYANFKLPEIVSEEKYSGSVNVFFEVTKEGEFAVLYIDGMYDELKTETQRVFSLLPKITPATYNGRPSFVQFTISLSVPLKDPSQIILDEKQTEETAAEKARQTLLASEYDNVETRPYANEEFRSNINIPLSHQRYGSFDAALNRVGLNNHTAQKPFVYSEANKYYDFEKETQPLLFEKSSWFGRKFWNEHFVAFSGKDYWLTLDPGVDLQVGKDFGDEINTYNNTRLVYVQGGIGKKLGFFAAVYESQGRFAGYFNRYAESIKPDGGNPAIIPGRGIAKEFKEDSYDYPIATGHISFTPSEHFNLQLGHGKSFIGDGYRSLLWSDNASPHPFFKLNTTFWKLKYTNMWVSLRDVRPAVTEDGSFRTKYMASHYLSYNISRRLNIGLFESVIWQNDNDRGFDFNYLNPIIFYRAIEFSTGSRGGNALIGLSAKYKFSNRVNAYMQLIIDEFSSGDVLGGDGSYKNKTGYQLGLKYYDAFGVKNLHLQAEYNRVRPYTYSHNTVVLNYGHNNQSMAHTLGANFSEFIGIARYQRGRVFGDLKIIAATRGLDFNTEEDPAFYGGDIFGSEDDRATDFGNELGQGNSTDFLHAELLAGYVINPLSNLKIYASVIFRDFKPETNTETVFETRTTWLNFGIRTDLFNWYYDF